MGLTSLDMTPANKPVISICVFVKISINQNPRVRSWPWRLHESEIQAQGNQGFFFLAASRLLFAALLLSHWSLISSGEKNQENLWDQGNILVFWYNFLCRAVSNWLLYNQDQPNNLLLRLPISKGSKTKTLTKVFARYRSTLCWKFFLNVTSN